MVEDEWFPRMDDLMTCFHGDVLSFCVLFVSFSLDVECKTSLLYFLFTYALDETEKRMGQKSRDIIA